MREIGQTIDGARLRVQKLVGIKLLIKFDEGRGKESLLEGEIVQAFPAVFTVKLSDGKTRSFSYTDVHTGNVLFLKQKED